jgi:hypothetical protein
MKVLCFGSSVQVVVIHNQFFVGIIYFDSGIKHPKIILDNYDYKIKVRLTNKTEWICSSYYKTRCPSRVTTTGKVAVLKGEHNHQPNPQRKYNQMMYQIVQIVKV